MYRSFVFFFLICCSLFSEAQQKTVVLEKTDSKILDRFMDKRFGMFIHWGPISMRGTEIGWSRNHEVSQQDYDSLYKEFNPVLFNADAWVKAAKDAGMKYITFTSKHHDGFSMWPTAYSNYNIMHSQYKKDIVGELAKACKKYDIKFCLYYTVLDWYDLNYPIHNNGIKEPDPKADMTKFIQYMKNQLKELVTNYHPYMIWFDGNWESPWTQEMGADIYNYLKKLDKNVIINNRLGKGTHKIMTPETVGDYATPEQEVGEINMSNPWESCITICHQWAWKPNDKMKTLKECIQTLVGTAGGNGNLLFNVGPMPDGRMEDRQVKRLKEMGDWLKVNGEAIYGTKGGPYKPDSVMAATRKGNKIYLHLFKRPGDQLVLPVPDGIKLLKANFISGVKVSYIQEGNSIKLSIPDSLPDSICTVIVLQMSTDTIGIPIMAKQ